MGAERQVSRVLIADPSDHVLLLHFRLRDGREVWIPPGGGADPGETAEEAAQREVLEETGISALGPLRLVWINRTHYFGRDVAESYFFARLPDHPTVVPEHAPHAPAELLGHRWWTTQELANGAAEAELTPREIGELLPAILAGQFTQAPVIFGS